MHLQTCHRYYASDLVAVSKVILFEEVKPFSDPFQVSEPEPWLSRKREVSVERGNQSGRQWRVRAIGGEL